MIRQLHLYKRTPEGKRMFELLFVGFASVCITSSGAAYALHKSEKRIQKFNDLNTVLHKTCHRLIDAIPEENFRAIQDDIQFDFITYNLNIKE